MARRLPLVLPGLVLLLVSGTALAFSGISVSISPDTSRVGLGQDVNVTVRIDSVGTPCSGFENTLSWDGQDLQFVSFQPEELLNEVSWTQWAGPDVYPDSTHIYILVYPFQGFLDHPGALYSFTLHALRLGSTPVRFSLAHFGSAYGGGISPVLTRGGEVLILDPSAVGRAHTDSRFGLRVAPNPLTPASRIDLVYPSSRPALLQIFDPAGRLQAEEELAAGDSRSSQSPGWCRTAPSGTTACSVGWPASGRSGGWGRGVYFLRLVTSAGCWTTAAVLP